MSTELLAACIRAAGDVLAARVAPVRDPRQIDDAIAAVARQIYARVSTTNAAPAIMAACVDAASAAVAARVALIQNPAQVDDAIAGIARATYLRLGE